MDLSHADATAARDEVVGGRADRAQAGGAQPGLSLGVLDQGGEDESEGPPSPGTLPGAPALRSMMNASTADCQAILKPYE